MARRSDFVSLGAYAYATLRERIESGTLSPGSRVRENEIASSLGISRTPVREALRRLEADGLLTLEPHRGVVVAELDHQAISELYTMREVLEGTAARLAARHADAAEIAALKDIAAAERRQSLNDAGAAAHNRRFHQSIYHAAHNRYLLHALSALGNAMALLGGTALGLPGRAQAARREHLRILRAIERRDETAAETAARAHIRAAHRARLALLFGAK